MSNPFSDEYHEDEDLWLLNGALNGSKEALEELIKRHKDFIYNIAFKMVLSPFDAEDITQEVIIKIITKIGQFKRNSNIRTWIYKITVNHCLQMKKKWLEERYNTISMFETDLDSVAAIQLSSHEEVEMKELVEEARLSCMSGMLLCLSREQRMVYILGEIFNVPHDLGAELLDISKENFRQRLSRARKDLYNFMDRKCGLLNKNNPCRCQKKTKGFIEAGWVDPDQMKFNTSYTRKIKDVISVRDEGLKKIEENDYKTLQREHPFQEKEFAINTIKNIVNGSEIKGIFNL
ncbi:RNA polymerase sigma factor [Paenibacillus glacialis]|uniref:RNA polymerase sigma factor n=1 Tax=Paenibacillus glacialis TaxID=494026 RepID=A0A168J2V2_9BACL|nr:RNA polymerase sigma factor [Paenibacillus glacialis]OAB40088.1 RNA polymerase subunit sigma-70 [Paenibacillus glacialis]